MEQDQNHNKTLDERSGSKNNKSFLVRYGWFFAFMVLILAFHAGQYLSSEILFKNTSIPIIDDNLLLKIEDAKLAHEIELQDSIKKYWDEQAKDEIKEESFNTFANFSSGIVFNTKRVYMGILNHTPNNAKKNVQTALFNILKQSDVMLMNDLTRAEVFVFHGSAINKNCSQKKKEFIDGICKLAKHGDENITRPLKNTDLVFYFVARNVEFDKNGDELNNNKKTNYLLFYDTVKEQILGIEYWIDRTPKKQMPKSI